MKIKLKRYFNTTILVSPEKAKKFCDRIKNILKREEEVILDFEGIQITTLVFLFVLFTNMWNECGKELRKKLIINNGSQGFFNQLNYLKENYKDLRKKFVNTCNNFEGIYIG